MEKIKYILFGLIWVIFIILKIIGISQITWITTLIGIPTIYFNVVLWMEPFLMDFKNKIKHKKEKEKMKIDILEPLIVSEVKEFLQTKDNTNYADIQIEIYNTSIDKIEQFINTCKSKEEANELKQQLIMMQFERQELLNQTGYSYKKRRIDKNRHF